MNTTAAAKITRNMNRQALRFLRREDAETAGRVIAPAYIADMVEAIDPTAYEVNAETDREKVAFFLASFGRAVWHRDNAYRFGARSIHQSAWPGIIAQGITDYLRGLPSCISVRFANWEMLEDARAKGFDIPENLESEFIDAIWAAYGFAIVRAALKFKIELPTATA